MYIRSCPNCGSSISYGTVYAMRIAASNKRLCKRCTGKVCANVPEAREASRRNLLIRYEENPLWNNGKANGFFGKHHTVATKAAIGRRDTSYMKTHEFSEAVKTGMNGKTNHTPVYECWLRRYGRQEANRRQVLLTQKQSKNATGVNNPMFGKPSPKGSGNGWQGYFHNMFFRSLRELSFLVYLKRHNIPWTSMEHKRDGVQYTDPLGNHRTYFADYKLIEDNQIIEIKPRRLWNTPLVQCKSRAMITYCRQQCWTYKLVDPKVLTCRELVPFMISGQVVFTEKTQLRFDEWQRTHLQ